MDLTRHDDRAVTSRAGHLSWGTPADVAVAAALFLFMTFGAIDAARDISGAAVVMLAVVAAPLVAHRRWPLTVFVTTFAAQLGYEFVALAHDGFPDAYEWLATTVALGSVARARGWRFAAPIAVVLAALPIGGAVAAQGLDGLDAEALLTVLGLTAAVAIGEAGRTRQAYLEETRERARLSELSREHEARRQADEERLRIARDVHDVVAHAIASINVQAGVGEHVAHRDPDGAVGALSQIRKASRTALDDLRAVLGMIRDDEGDRAPDTAAGLDDLDRLVALARDAGLEVEVAVSGDRGALPRHVEQAAYRIVQESVTNAVKHAGDAHLWIAIAYQPERVDICVENDGAGPVAPVTEGHGMRGLRERAADVGGIVEAGPRDGGGFAVHAQLPLGQGTA